MVIWKRGWAVFEEDGSPRMVDGRKTYDKSGRQRRGTGILLRLEPEIEKKERGFMHRRDFLVGHGGYLPVGLAAYSCLLAVASMSKCVHFEESGHTAPYPQARALEAPCKFNDITCANELQNTNGR